MININNAVITTGSDILIENLNLNIDSKHNKKIALIGPNGCGKSTLMKTIIGEKDLAFGNISNSKEIIEYLPQEIEFPKNLLVGEYLESKLEASWMNYRIDKVFQDIGIDEDFLIHDIGTLSGGEKVRIKLCEILLKNPTIIMMDEPTNHLDTEGVEWLIDFIQKFKGTIIVVSHDRYLINACLNEVWDISTTYKELRVYGGNYEQYKILKEQEQQNIKENYQRHVDRIKELERWLSMFEMHPKYRFSSIVMAKKRALDNLRRIEIKLPEIKHPIKISNLDRINKESRLVKMEVVEKCFDMNGVRTTLGLSVQELIYQGEKILISGPNGSGKTTLLNIISGDDTNYNGEIVYKDGLKIGYMKQFSEFADNPVETQNFASLQMPKTVFEIVLARTNLSETEARGLLAKYNFKSDRVTQNIETMSYGERRRLDLAIILSSKPNLLILDEPTNHLDIDTREQLEDFIMEQNIAKIIVSHDRYFIEKIGIDREIKL